MADLLGTSRPAPSEERTVPEETADSDAFAGLPVGGTLDEAAQALRSPPAPAMAVSGAAAITVASSTLGVVPDVGGEDPLALALRIAHQAQAQAAALEATATEPGSNGNGAHPDSEPIAEPTVPGIPSFSGNGQASEIAAAVASGVGVVPEAPDNEDTVRARANATASTVDSGLAPEVTLQEPTLPSESDLLAPDTSDSGPVIGEETPVLTEAQRASLLAEEAEPDTVVEDSQPGAVPDSPSTERTPSAARAPMPEEPREEPTIRKSGPPPALVAPVRLAARTGTGPSGIGALGFRISSNRAVVRPNFNGRVSASAAPTMPLSSQVSGSTSIERPSERISIERGIDRPSRAGIPVAARAPLATPVASVVVDPPPVVTGRPASKMQMPQVPTWVLGVGAVALAMLCGGGAVLLWGGGTPETPVATPTAVVEASPEVTDTAVAVLTAAPTPTSTSAPSRTATATPIPATPSPAPTRTPAPTATPAPSIVAVIATKTPIPATSSATPRATASAKERIATITQGRKDDRARMELNVAAFKPANLADPDFTYECFQWFAKPPSDLSPEGQKNSRDMARRVGLEFLKRHGGDENRRKAVRSWIDLYDGSIH